MTRPRATPRRVVVRGDLFHGRVPAGAVYVGRAAPGLPASPYANPHRVGRCRRCGVDHDRIAAIEAYEQDLRGDPELLAAAHRDLTGRDLACWCGPDQSCHADVLLRHLDGAAEAREATVGDNLATAQSAAGLPAQVATDRSALESGPG